MKILHRRPIVAVYFVLSVALPIILLYPALIYGDLSGMGGYDGFASLEMMTKYGSWVSDATNSVGYIFFSGLNILWLLSLINIPIAVILAFKVLRERNRFRDKISR
jgi:hypothetical protein